MPNFSCGKRSLDYGLYAATSASSRAGPQPLRLVVAIDDVTGHLMACLKCLVAKQTPASIKAAMSKVRFLRRYRHVNIVEYKGACIRDGSLCLLMEMCDGGSIASILTRFGALDTELAVRYTHQILCGVDYLHVHGLVHRHLTCSTCLVTTTGHVKLADFGALSAMLAVDPTSEEDVVQRDVKYPPPEAARLARGEPVRQSDIWSVGCCLLEMLTAQQANELKGRHAPGARRRRSLATEPPLPPAAAGNARLFPFFVNSRRDADREVPGEGDVAGGERRAANSDGPEEVGTGVYNRQGGMVGTAEAGRDGGGRGLGGRVEAGVPAAVPTIPESLPEMVKQFLEACLQEDFRQRPTARRLLGSELMLNVQSQRLQVVSAEVIDAQSCSLPMSLQAPFSLFRWLYDLADQEHELEAVEATDS